MAGRRLLGVAIIFCAGAAVGVTALRLTQQRPVTTTQAQARALRVLDQSSAPTSIGDNRIVQAVKRIEPSVVNIDTVGKAPTEEDAGTMMSSLEREVRGKGSGVILTQDGYIVTNNHVIEGANRIRVTLPDGHWYYAQQIGHDPQTDLAVIRIEAANLTPAELGDSDKLQVGEWSIAVGNPLGLGSTITVGVISALNRRNLPVDAGHNLDGAIQTDAAINRGNSGGALANIAGQLVGINTAILSSGPSGGSIGLGFSIPSNTVRRVARELIAHGKVAPHKITQPWMGVRFGVIPPNFAKVLNIPPDQGIRVERVMPQSPASQAGILNDDIILFIDDKAIRDSNDILEAVRQHQVGEHARVRLLRPSDRSNHTLSLLLAERPAFNQLEELLRGK